MQPGSIVSFREREWVLMPSEDESIYRLRPLTGTTDQVVEVHKLLCNILGQSLPERLKPAYFSPPSAKDLSDSGSSLLLWQAARLTLRDGASPIRSLGKISIRPRTYQFVPLLMALRLDPVRLFIADDVGVGKTIEALLVARELFDRGEIRRMAVLCPPYLCDQWEKELRQKFNLDAVVIQSSTIARLERHLPPSQTVYQRYPVQVISIDWVKSHRNKHQFLQFCPELIIVDEAHGAAEAGEGNTGQQQRHRLLQEIAKDEKRHLILLTATPHSGVETAFRSLLGLLRPEFRHWDTGSLTDEQRKELARHFVQRTRSDIKEHWEGAVCFPQRINQDKTYSLSDAYRNLFNKTYNFCSEIVQSGEGLKRRERRVRYWGALALLRCVMSSPAAALAALETRIKNLSQPSEETDEEPLFGPFVFEDSYGITHDEVPTPPIEESEKTLAEKERRKLRELMGLARQLAHSKDDTKMTTCRQVVKELLSEGFNPIVWCRYVATAEYVAEGLKSDLPNVQVLAITGRMGDEERRAKIEALDGSKPRVLVATDCLSEGINLQHRFSAVVHYDLPWNPNRLEQREGRVDRYGQGEPEVKSVRFYGRDNPVDGAVIKVLLNKAQEIHRSLGTYVPVPEESESVMEAVLKSILLRHASRSPGQLGLDYYDREFKTLHVRWDEAAMREKRNRTRFAQRAIKVKEVKRELEAVDSVLGTPDEVREFVLAASQRLGLQIQKHPNNQEIFVVHLQGASPATLPPTVQAELPQGQKEWLISFVSPTPAGAEYLGRNHPFVAALARHLFEEAISNPRGAVASRCGVIRTSQVDTLTTLLLLRVRHLVEIPQKAPMLSEEVIVTGYRFKGFNQQEWLSHKEALQLLTQATPVANVPKAEKEELVKMALDEIAPWESGQWGNTQVQRAIREQVVQRARQLEESHKRVRQAVSLRIRELRVKPQLPPDLLGIVVLQPEVRP